MEHATETAVEVVVMLLCASAMLILLSVYVHAAAGSLVWIRQ